ncbi:Dda-like helicase [Cronobacter phage S13]|jgi:hypothetical protein|uniref:ATP-dependent RecD-like DNA helicase n=1 Tax=Cronobacter phage LPCS28 TaxID=2924885 RepID=A0AAE9K6L2_9CAUD|nr:Dda-like helicase [Cronobacter phage S13]YP_010665901.1 Dda-like helicase [Cronobacter phage LPCS28]AIA64849.1 putative DNA helicase [Cronobacter phage S13]UNY47090.1 ATP-dependent RecD-like DNA helicase [Cronobacter phage LPCS28]
MVELSKCQEKVLEAFKTHRGHITIRGPAGVGKSFITKYLIDSCEDKNGIFLATPTHQAKIVLAKMSGLGVSTLHSLLKIHPQTYEEVRTFEQNGDPELQDCRLLFIDEASMVDDDLFAILMQSIHPHCRIVAIGDYHQLQPVKHEAGKISPFFLDERFLQVEMTTILRQAADNPIIQVATGIREGGQLYHLTKQGKGVFNLPDLRTYFKLFFTKVKQPDDLLNFRMLAFTNDIVDKCNTAIRSEIYKTEEPYVPGEYLVLQQPVVIKEKYKGIEVVETLFNNGQIVQIEDLRKEVFQLNLPLAGKRPVNMYQLMCRDLETNEVKPMKVLAGIEDKIELSDYLNQAAQLFKGSTSKYKKAMWNQFWTLKDTFAETKPLGANTVHKSQGITLTGCLYYTRDKSYTDYAIQQQLDYVACTRPTDFLAYM